MKNQLDEVSIRQVALVRCVASILYSSIHRQYRLFPVFQFYQYCPAPLSNFQETLWQNN